MYKELTTKESLELSSVMKGAIVSTMKSIDKMTEILNDDYLSLQTLTNIKEFQAMVYTDELRAALVACFKRLLPEHKETFLDDVPELKQRLLKNIE